MLLQLIDTILLIFITLNLGIVTRDLLARFFRTPLHTDLLELFLLGLLSSSIYFNILSFFRPVDYTTLLPLCLLSLAVTFFYRQKSRTVWLSVRNNVTFLFSGRRWIVTTVIGIVLLFYWLLPCGTDDSLIYHFQSILWYEKFKVVPGLANLNGRLGFNPASFLIESAYSFSDIAGQALYPLNGAATLFLFSWLLLRVLRHGRSLISLLYAALIILVFRHTLIDISSPTSDGMSVTCMVYILVRIAEYSLSRDKTPGAAILPALITLFAIVIKPATFALLPALPYLYFTLPRTQRKTMLLLRVALLSLLIYLPWLGRNYILSGYLVFPFSATGFFHPDWKVPKDLVKLEINLIHIAPKMERHFKFDWTPAAAALARTPLGWFPHWVKDSFADRFMDLMFLFMALLSPLYWLIRLFWKKDRSPLLFPWVLAFAAMLLWMQASPVFRFGSIYVCMTLMLPFFDLAYVLQERPLQKGNALLAYLPRLYPGLLVLPLLLTIAYYLYTGYTRPSSRGFNFADCWVRPIQSAGYNLEEKTNFPYRVLKNGTKLYLADDTHNCINTCLPCMEFKYGEIEMRGASLADGFRNTLNEIKYHYGEMLW